MAFSNIDPSAKMLSYSGIFQRVPANSPSSTLKSFPQATGHFRQVVSRSQYRSLKRSPLMASACSNTSMARFLVPSAPIVLMGLTSTAVPNVLRALVPVSMPLYVDL